MSVYLNECVYIYVFLFLQLLCALLDRTHETLLLFSLLWFLLLTAVADVVPALIR